MSPQLKALLYPAIIALLVLTFFLGKSCASKPPVLPDKTENLKKEKVQEKKIRAEVVRKDSIVHHWHTVYQKERYDSIIPCPEKLVVADTVIFQDSSLIYSLKRDLSKLDTIIAIQEIIAKNDSISIVGLKKEIKRQKKQKWLIGGLVVLFGGIAVVK